MLNFLGNKSFVCASCSPIKEYLWNIGHSRLSPVGENLVATFMPIVGFMPRYDKLQDLWKDIKKYKRMSKHSHLEKEPFDWKFYSILESGSRYHELFKNNVKKVLA